MARPLFGEVLPEQHAQPSPAPSRLTNMRFTFSQLFSGAPTTQPPSPSEPTYKEPQHEEFRPMSPAAITASAQLASPYPRSPVSPSAYSLPSPMESPHVYSESVRSLYRSPSIPSPTYQEFATQPITTADPEEQRLAELVQHEQQRRRRKHKRRRHHHHQYHTRHAHPGRRRARKGARRCFPSVEDPVVRRKFFLSLISGMMLTVLLTTYLSLALSNRMSGRVFHVLFILSILLTTIVFCHSLIRLCMIALRPSRTVDQSCRARRAEEAYAQVEEPIAVVVEGDEEEALGVKTEETIKCPPPAYGFLRGSVRVDPNLMFWQRREHPAYVDHPAYRGEGGPHDMRPTTGTQPPEYQEGQAF